MVLAGGGGRGGEVPCTGPGWDWEGKVVEGILSQDLTGVPPPLPGKNLEPETGVLPPPGEQTKNIIFQSCHERGQN